MSPIISALIAAVIVAPITWLAAVAYRKKSYESKIGSAEEKSREIIDEALKVAETKKKEALLEAKEENLKAKNELEKETRERRAEIQRYERRVLSKEENLDKKAEAMERKESSLASREDSLKKRTAEVEELFAKEQEELEKISGLTSDQAKEYLLKSVEADVKHDTAKLIKELETRAKEEADKKAKEYVVTAIQRCAADHVAETTVSVVQLPSAKLIKELETRAKEEADKKAKEYVVTAIQRCAADHVAETTVSVVQLPSDEMKGRIIGREGRNIRTLETMTGVELIIDDTPEAVVLSGFDPVRREVARIALERLIVDGRIHPARITMTGVELIIDDTPEAVVLSGFDPVRREVARIALERLIVDGRIHPARIEEMVEKAQKEVENMMREEGEAAALEVGIHGIHPELVKLLGKMKFRTSYGQNALKHSIEVAQLSGLLASEIGVDVRLAKRAGLLHDIGKSVDHEMEGSHVQLGSELCKKYKESATVINAVESHHGDVEPTSLISCIVQAADTISAARPGARRETLETYTNRLKQLEDITNSFKGVDKSFAVEPTSLISCIVQAADTISAARPGARRETLETYTNRLKQLEDITNSFKGVDKSFAIQAGREVRIMVVPEQVSDDDMVLMAREISKKVESELEYPGSRQDARYVSWSYRNRSAMTIWF